MAIERKDVTPFVVVITFGVLGGFALWYWGAPMQSVIERNRPATTGGHETLAPSEIESGRVAERYVRAVQQGLCEEVSRTTWWMQERLSLARRTGTAQDVAEAQRELCSAITSRESSGNTIGSEGIGDQYLLRPESTWRIIRVDEGRDDLVKPVSQRAWLAVTYMLKTRAPLDERGNPIRSMVIGINVSHDDYVLKAGVRGNLDIDFDSFQYDW